MTYEVCLIHENKTENPQSYPYKDVVLIQDAGVFRFPEQEGEAVESQTGFSKISPQLQLALATIPSDRRPVFSGITESSSGKQVAIFIIPESYLSIPNPETPVIFQNTAIGIRVVMDEIRQGKVCHCAIHSSVRNLFFGTSGDVTPATTPYFYEPASALLARPLSLVRAPADTPDTILHSPGYYRIPMIGYHGTAETFVSDTVVSGLKATKRNGMYGDDAYYFGSFHKAVRYAFRDSGYASMKQRTPLYKSIRPAGFLEVPNTAHTTRSSSDIQVDLIRDAPAVVRFVLFVKNPVYMPQNARNLDTTPPKVIKSLPPNVSNAFVQYDKNPEGTGKIVFSRDYVSSQIGEELFDGTAPTPSTITDEDDLEIPADSSREEAVLRLYRAIHVATRPAFA